MSESTTNRIARRESGTGAKEDRIEVLRMLESGAITADDAARLLDALDKSERQLPALPEDLTQPLSGQEPVRRVRIQVHDAKGSRVNLAVPLNLVDAGLAIARRVAPERLGDVGTLRQAILSGMRGPVLEVHGEDGAHVMIVVE